MIRLTPLAAVVSACCVYCSTSNASIVTYFNSPQVVTSVASGVTSDTVSSNGYVFTYTRDKLFTGGVGITVPIGRPVLVSWPTGVEGQAVTTGPNPSGAQFTSKRVDGGDFDLIAFTAKLLANTAATCASFEIMPALNGQDGFSDPLYFDATGYSFNTFSYNTSPNYLGSTAQLTGFDTYSIGLFTDFAITGLTLAGAPVSEPSDFALAGLGAFVSGTARFLQRKKSN